MKCIECVNVTLTKPFAGQKKTKRILDRITAQFHGGSMSLISGATGAGKSSLIHILAGIIRPTEGEVMADLQRVSRWTSYHRDRWRQKVGIIFQRSYLLADLTVFENVCLPLIPRKLPVKTMRKKAMGALECLGMNHMAFEKVMFLSGGERQRVSAARAFVADPEMILADEPTAHQDEENVNRLMNILVQFKRKNAVIITASHDVRLLRGKGFDFRFTIEKGRMKPVD